MQIFINEMSLHGQYNHINDFEKAVRIFRAMLYLLNEKKIKNTFFDKRIYLYSAIRNKNFIGSLNKLNDKSIKNALIRVLNDKLNAIDWINERQHSIDDEYKYKEENVTDSSIAELAERKIRSNDLICFLMNFAKSKFETLTFITVIKNNNETIDLDCIEDKQSLEKWLEKNLNLTTFEYNYSSKVPPTDKQTVLRDSKVFEPTHKFYDSRRTYCNIETGYFWYVDNFHFGQAAHLEVFDTKGNHIGEADLDGNIDWSKKDSNKRIYI